MAKHLDFRTARYRKGDVILSAGSIVTDIGLVLSGSVRIEYTDLWGKNCSFPDAACTHLNKNIFVIKTDIRLG